MMRKSIAGALLALVFASFEAAAQFCPGLSPWVFADVPSNHPFCTDITWMAQRGVTLGCASINATQRLYCPDQGVRRDQMAAFMHRLSNAILPLTCTSGQVMKWDGVAWSCANDNLGGSGGGGTVTSVAAGTGLLASPSPITGAGALSIAPGYRLPQSCTTSQIARWNGSAWICSADTAGGGSVTSLSQGNGITLTPNPIVGAGTIAANTAYLQRRVTGTCDAESSMRTINADGSVVCGAENGGRIAFLHGGNAFGSTAVLGTATDVAMDVIVNGSRVMRFEPHGVAPNVIGGMQLNAVAPGLFGATIAGGGALNKPNLVHAGWSTVGGGSGNEAGPGGWSTVGGGDSNVASGTWSTIGGGIGNLASGNLSAIPGGSSNWAGGANSVVMGHRAFTLPAAEGSFVFADSTDADFASHGPNEFLVAASGGIGLYTSKSATTYCRMNPGGGSWNCSSSRKVKRDFASVDTIAALEKVAALSLSSWRFVSEPADVRHIGPMAEDFRAAFGLGSDERSISSVDVQGVALAAIQGLNAKLEQRLRDKDAAIEALSARLESELATLRAALKTLTSNLTTER